MGFEDNDNLYVLKDEENDIDNSPKNFAAYDFEDQEEIETEERDKEGSKNAFRLLFHIMFNPVEGWKVLRRTRIKIENLQSGCFYPLLALLALSKFADFFYSVNVTLSQVVSQAVVIFVSYFFGYFSIPILLSWFLPKEMVNKFDGRFGKEFILVALSTLALFSIVINLLPMIWPILIFLPIWTLYLMFKGTRFFLFPQNQEMKFFVLSGVITIGIPLLIEWALTSVI